MSRMKIALALCPCWSNFCPPLGIAYIASALKDNGYDVKCFDLNIEAYHMLKQSDVDYWDFGNFNYWLDEAQFSGMLLPQLREFFADKVKEIITYGPDVIGFGVFDTSALASLYVAREIKSLAPDKKIIFGGHECYKERIWQRFLKSGFVDAVVVGEGEETIAELLGKYKETNKFENIRGTIIKKDENIVDGGLREDIKDLNKVTFPDFIDFKIERYKMQALPIMTSRGCVARCAFCGEVGKFRFRKAENIAEELKRDVMLHNPKEIFFNDSLINGNISELSRLASLIIENNIDIRWGGYARVDSRLDLVLLKNMKRSGCTYLSYGVESGSQKVLNDMNKHILLKDAEKNIRDTRKAGIEVHLNWIIGFPTESVWDFMQSLIFVYKNRKYISNLNPGHGCGIIQNSYLCRNLKKYKVSKQSFLNNWRTTDFTNTIIHRRIRLKIFRKWLEILKIRHT